MDFKVIYDDYICYKLLKNFPLKIVRAAQIFCQSYFLELVCWNIKPAVDRDTAFPMRVNILVFWVFLR